MGSGADGTLGSVAGGGGAGGFCSLGWAAFSTTVGLSESLSLEQELLTLFGLRGHKRAEPKTGGSILTGGLVVDGGGGDVLRGAVDATDWGSAMSPFLIQESSGLLRR